MANSTCKIPKESRKNPEGYKKIKVRLSQAAPFLKLIYHNLYKNNSLSITQYLPTICTGILRHPLGWEPYHTTHGTPERYTSYVLIARHTLRDMPEQYLWSIERFPTSKRNKKISTYCFLFSIYCYRLNNRHPLFLLILILELQSSYSMCKINKKLQMWQIYTQKLSWNIL